jgi:uncharacterized protein YlxW (UPF0749 family)
VCLVAGLLLGTARSWSSGHETRTRSVDLSVLVAEGEERVQQAERTAASLRSQVEGAASADLSPQVEQVLTQVQDAEPQAGLTPVTGPGLRVSLTDAPRDSDGNYPAGVNPDDLVVHQQDVQAVVNGLWAGGAEAMMIMDQRVVTTSAVRCIGNVLLLQGRTYSPPFVVTAIGDPDRMRAAVREQPGVQLFQRYVDRYDLGFEVVDLDSVELPGYDGSIRPTSADAPPR